MSDNKSEIETKSEKVLYGLEGLMPEIVAIILVRYEESVKSINRSFIELKPETVEMKLRLIFECLCFSTYYCCAMAGHFITIKRRWRKNKPDFESVERFHGVIGYNLMQTCNRIEACELREIVIVEMDTETLKPVFGEGDKLDPISRLDEYREALVTDPGSEIRQFGMYIGKSLDASHYPTFELIGGSIAPLMLESAQKVMKETFK